MSRVQIPPGQSVFDIVCHGDGLFLGFKGRDADHRYKTSSHARVERGGTSSKNCRRYVISLLEPLGAVSARDHPRPLGDAFFDTAILNWRAQAPRLTTPPPIPFICQDLCFARVQSRQKGRP